MRHYIAFKEYALISTVPNFALVQKATLEVVTVWGTHNCVVALELERSMIDNCIFSTSFCNLIFMFFLLK